MDPNRNIWYPFSQQKLADNPIFLTHGKGSLLFDRDGNSYIDAISSWWTNIHGHAHPYLAAAIKNQFDTLEHVIFAGFTHEPAEQLSERLLRYLPFLSKVFFSDNGSTAVEVGIKMAIQYWHNNSKPKRKIIALEGAYHGDTFGAMSVSERDAFTAPFKKHLFETVYLPLPFERNEEACLHTMRTLCNNKDIAAFIYEPLVQGAAGMQMYSPVLLNQLLGIAKEHGILCIADEVMTGFYRTGTLFASDQCQHKPDIICLSKGITGGSMPLSVTICSQDIYNAFYSNEKAKAFWHGHSYTGNPLACAVANANLDLLENRDTISAIKRIITRHEDFRLQKLSQSTAIHIRQTGTILAWDIQVADAGYFSNIRDQLYAFAIERGVLLRPLGNALYILPPYCMTDSELDQVYVVCEEMLALFGK